MKIEWLYSLERRSFNFPTNSLGFSISFSFFQLVIHIINGEIAVKKFYYRWILVVLLLCASCLNINAETGCIFKSFKQFKSALDSLANIPDSSGREIALNAFWDSLKFRQQIPFVFGDSVALLYRGAAGSVLWHGDFDGWNREANKFTGTRVGLSHVWRCVASFPKDARLDYKVVVDGNWILDPDNPLQQWSGWGPNSELRMPDWQYPRETIVSPEIAKGTLSENEKIFSLNLGYEINYRIYTPAKYELLSNLPVIYVTDGHEYLSPHLGSMMAVLDNLISEKKIEPIMAVFIDPRNPHNPNENRRANEYTMNENFLKFVADELVPQIDDNYHSDPCPANRAILGTSLGGINSAYFGVSRSDVFQLIAINSPAFQYKEAIFASYQALPKLPLKIFISTGVIFDTEESARKMKKIFDEKGYQVKYIEVNEGHSWGNWRGLVDDMLIYFFGMPD